MLRQTGWTRTDTSLLSASHQYTWDVQGRLVTSEDFERQAVKFQSVSVPCMRARDTLRTADRRHTLNRVNSDKIRSTLSYTSSLSMSSPHAAHHPPPSYASQPSSRLTRAISRQSPSREACTSMSCRIHIRFPNLPEARSSNRVACRSGRIGRPRLSTAVPSRPQELMDLHLAS